jgi:hypothetical protein
MTEAITNMAGGGGALNNGNDLLGKRRGRAKNVWSPNKRCLLWSHFLTLIVISNTEVPEQQQ